MSRQGGYTVNQQGRPAGPRDVAAEVTAADILAGVPGSVTDYHPIALAVRRALGLGPQVPPYIGVGDDWFSIHVHGSFHESHDLPDGCAEWIERYDRRQHVRPFRFTFRTAWGVAAA